MAVPKMTDDARRQRAQTFAREIWFAEHGADIAAPTWLTQALLAFADAEVQRTPRLCEDVIGLLEGWRAGAKQCKEHAALNHDPALSEAGIVLRECAAELEAHVLNSLLQRKPL